MERIANCNNSVGTTKPFPYNPIALFDTYKIQRFKVRVVAVGKKQWCDVNACLFSEKEVVIVVSNLRDPLMLSERLTGEIHRKVNIE